MSKKIERFEMGLLVDEVRGHRNVPVTLYHRDDLPERVYETMVPARFRRKCRCLHSVVNMTFDADEVNVLWRYFAGMQGILAVKVRRASPIDNENLIGPGAISPDEATDAIPFYARGDWPLSVRVCGHHHLMNDAFGPWPIRREPRPLPCVENDIPF